MKIIVGLGNPGKKYEGTRHNVGWLVVNELANQTTDGQWLMIKKLKSSIISHRSLIVLAKPTVFMNESGRAVKSLLKHFKIEPANLWIVHDDIDLSLGRIKIQVGGGAAGHHGVESIIK
jgi:PTH1 family peptidyl-tRNA hydrolase